jgi:hypothetical protein
VCVTVLCGITSSQLAGGCKRLRDKNRVCAWHASYKHNAVKTMRPGEKQRIGLYRHPSSRWLSSFNVIGIICVWMPTASVHPYLGEGPLVIESHIKGAGLDTAGTVSELNWTCRDGASVQSAKQAPPILAADTLSAAWYKFKRCQPRPTLTWLIKVGESLPWSPTALVLIRYCSGHLCILSFLRR